jgi:hypothetical protein
VVAENAAANDKNAVGTPAERRRVGGIKFRLMLQARRGIRDSLAGATGLEPATFGVTGRSHRQNDERFQWSILFANGINGFQ